MAQRHPARPGTFGLPRHFTHLDEFIVRAQAGDTYRETSADGMAVTTFKAKSLAARSRRTPRQFLRVERVMTDLVARGAADYMYRTRSTVGNLFGTRNRNGDPAFLALVTPSKVLKTIEIGQREHSPTLFEDHHIKVATPHPNRVSA